MAKNSAGAKEIQEELAYLRQKCGSLSFRGSYAECSKLIESNMQLLYFQERNLDNFFAMLRIHQRCYPSLNHSQSYDQYLENLLVKNGIPPIFVELLKNGKTVDWSADRFRKQAIAEKNAGNLERALANCELALKIEPFSSNASLLKGWILEDLGRRNEAEKMYEQALELNETNYQASNSLARRYMEKDLRHALRYVEQAIEKFPDEASFHATKAQIRLKMGEREGAMSDYDQAIILDPYNSDYLCDKADLMAEDGMDRAAMSLYEKALAVNDRHVPTLLRLAQACAKHSPGRALEHARSALKWDPENVPAQLLCAQLLRRTGDISGAARQYRKLLEKDENHVEALEGLGYAYVRTEPDKALQYFKRALEKTASPAACHMGMAEAYLQLSDREAAIREYKAAIGLDKENAKAHAELGRLYAEEKPETALQYLEKATRLEPKNAYYHTDRGLLLAKMPGRESEALKCLSLASRLDQGNASLHIQLADLLDAAGKRTSAIRHYQQAVHINPDLHGGHYGLTRLLMNTEPQKTLVHITAAIRLNQVCGVYYYTKAQVLFRIHQDERRETLLAEARELAEKAGEQALVEEIDTLRKGETLRMALYYVDRAVEREQQVRFACLRARLFNAMGERKKAVAQYEELLKENPECHEALFGLGCLLAEGKEKKKALEFMDRAIRLAPAEAQYHGGKAQLLAEEPDRYAAAVESFTMAAELDHYAWELLLQQAGLMDEHGDLPGAQGCYRKALLAHRGCVPAAYRMSELLIGKKPLAALSYIDHALGLEPENVAFHAQKAAVLLCIGEETAARKECDTALDLGIGSAQAHFQLAQALAAVAPQKALEYALSAAAKGDLGAQGHQLCGKLYCDLGEYYQAGECYAKVVSLDPGNHEAREQVARLLYLREDPGAAEAVDAALEQQESCAACHYLKGCLLLRSGEEAEALDCVLKAVDLAPEEPEYRQKLVELYQKRRSLLKYYKEKHRLEKLLKKLREAERRDQETEEIDFGQTDEEDGGSAAEE